MKAIWLVGLAMTLWASAASAEWRQFVHYMAVDVEADLPSICFIDEAVLASQIGSPYQEAGVAVVTASASAPEPAEVPHRHSVMMTGTYGGGGYCVVAIASYVTREHLVIDAPTGARQQVAYFVTSAFLIAPPDELQQRLEVALTASAVQLARGAQFGAGAGLGARS